MTPPPTPESPRDQHDELADLLHDAVSDVEPTERLADIRQRLEESTMSNRSATPVRRPWLGVLGAAAAVALAAGTVAVVTQRDDDSPPPVSTTTSAPTSSSTSRTADIQVTTVPVYYVIDTANAGPRLVREFHELPGEPFRAALHDAAVVKPRDDAYTTLLPGDLGPVSVEGEGAEGQITVTVPDPAWADPVGSQSMRANEQAVQQVVWTLQGVAGTRADVLFVDPSGQPMDTFLGVDVAGGANRASALRTLNLISITSPVQGETVSGDTLTVTGLVNSFEGSGPCSLIAGGEEVATVPYQTDGWMADRLFPFTVTLPLADAGTGDVVVRCETSDPTGGTEGDGVFADDKLISVR